MNHAAKELLELERRATKREFSEEESQRWFELATSLFGPDQGTLVKDFKSKRRRTFRIPLNQNCKIKFGAHSYTCSIREVGHVNMTISGNSLPPMEPHAPIEIESIEVGKNWISFGGIPGKVVSVRWADNVPSVGLELSPSISDREAEIFRKEIYYPAYIHYLEHLAGDA